ncbi:MAG: hypothetical protein ABIA74_05895 [bacterium]
MKKILGVFLILLFVSSPVFARRGHHGHGGGGAAFGGALAGSMVGSLVGSAATSKSSDSSSSRAETEALRAQDQAAALRHEQQLRQEIAFSSQSESTRMIMFFSLIFLLLIIGVLAIFLFRKRR